MAGARLRSDKGFTVVEMVFAVVMIAVMTGIYFVMVDRYKERRMSEQAAKVLMLAAKAQEEYFEKSHRYFDADIAGASEKVRLTPPDGKPTSVSVPPHVVLSLRTVGPMKKAFVGRAYYTGGSVTHRYDSRTGRMTTEERSEGNS